jgi:vesicle coat complex subunit
MDEKPNPEFAALTLASLGAEPQTSLPALIHSLDSSNGLMRLFTAQTLTNFPAQAPMILPALSNRLDDSSPAVRAAASNSIRNILNEKSD